jgi:hypothetical protein
LDITFGGRSVEANQLYQLPRLAVMLNDVNVHMNLSIYINDLAT